MWAGHGVRMEDSEFIKTVITSNPVGQRGKFKLKWVGGVALSLAKYFKYNKNIQRLGLA